MCLGERGQAFQTGKLLGKRRPRKAGTTVFNSNVLTPFLLLRDETTPEEQRYGARWGGPLVQLQSIKQDYKRSKEIGNKREVYISDVGFETVFLSSGNWRQIPCEGPSRAVCPSISPEQL